MISSACVTASRHISLASAGLDFGQKVKGQLGEKIEGLRKSGWPAFTGPIEVSDDNDAQGAQVAGSNKADDTVVAKDTAPLAGLAAAVLSEGSTNYINGSIATLLGVTKNDEKLVVRQKAYDAKDHRKVLSVGEKDGETYIIIAFRTKEDGTLYLTTPSGVLKKAIAGKKGEDPQEIPLADAQKRFQEERDFWVKELCKPPVRVAKAGETGK